MKTKPVKTHSSSKSVKDLESSLARALADYANLEKRFARDSASIVQFANANLLAKLLEVRDHLGLAASHGDQSLELILSAFDKILTEEGVTIIKTHGVFDPNLMECHETAFGTKDHVISVIRPGYILNGRVLRPARVIVGNGQINSSN